MNRHADENECQRRRNGAEALKGSHKKVRDRYGDEHENDAEQKRNDGRRKDDLDAFERKERRRTPPLRATPSI